MGLKVYLPGFKGLSTRVERFIYLGLSVCEFPEWKKSPFLVSVLIRCILPVPGYGVLGIMCSKV